MTQKFKWLALIPALWPATGHAFDWTPDTTSYLTDPSFRVHKGQIESITTYGLSNTNDDWRYISGSINEHRFDMQSFYGQTFNYGVTDRLRVTGSASYSGANLKYTYDNMSPSDQQFYGFSNPTLGVTYRIIEQHDSPISFDGNVHYVPNIISDASQSGGGELLLNRNLKSLTLQLIAGADYYSPTKQNDGYNVNQQWSYYVGFNDQLRITSRWHLNSGVKAHYLTMVIFTNPSAGYVYTEKYDVNILPYVTLYYTVVPHKIAIGLEYDHNFNGDHEQAGSFNGTWTNDITNAVYLHLNMLF